MKSLVSKSKWVSRIAGPWHGVMAFDMVVTDTRLQDQELKSFPNPSTSGDWQPAEADSHKALPLTSILQEPLYWWPYLAVSPLSLLSYNEASFSDWVLRESLWKIPKWVILIIMTHNSSSETRLLQAYCPINGLNWPIVNLQIAGLRKGRE